MSRSNGRSRSLRRRPSRVVAASITAAVITAIGVLGTISALVALIKGSWPSVVRSAAGQTAAQSWGSAAVITTGVVVVVVGLIALIAGVKPGGFRSATLQPPSGGSVPVTDYVISTRAMARLAAARADTVDGVEHVSATATGRAVRVSVTTSSEQSADIRERVQREVADVFTAADLRPVPRVTTTVHVKGI